MTKLHKWNSELIYSNIFIKMFRQKICYKIMDNTTVQMYNLYVLKLDMLTLSNLLIISLSIFKTLIIEFRELNETL